jgi:hypothetical protein
VIGIQELLVQRDHVTSGPHGEWFSTRIDPAWPTKLIRMAFPSFATEAKTRLAAVMPWLKTIASELWVSHPP